MADLQLVCTTDGEGYYVTDGENESDSADWNVITEFDGVRYIGETDGENATLSEVKALASDAYEVVDEDDADDADDEAEGVASAAD